MYSTEQADDQTEEANRGIQRKRAHRDEEVLHEQMGQYAKTESMRNSSQTF